ncbi:hypothetical protein KQH50_02555 [bacterium]|nr:hypothetical protein [bacterium]
MNNKSKTLIALAVLAGIVMLALPTGTVAAQPQDPPRGEGRPDREPRSLEELYGDLIQRYNRVGDRLDDADRPAERLEDRIETLTENGEDADGLQTILDTFQANLAEVQTAYADLGEIVDEHAGFDDDGAVTDESLAVTTLRQIADGLLDVHQLGEDTRFALRWDLTAYRFENQVDD